MLKKKYAVRRTSFLCFLELGLHPLGLSQGSPQTLALGAGLGKYLHDCNDIINRIPQNGIHFFVIRHVIPSKGYV